MSDIRFRVRHGWQPALRAQPKYKAAMKELTVAVHAAAVEIAPTGESHGGYRRRLKVVGNSVVATDIAGHLVEWGSVNNPPYAVLRRAALAVGLRLMPSPK